MEVLVTYFSKTGNTRKIAEAIYDEINRRKRIKPMADVADLNGYDLTFVGFPVWEFYPALPAKQFLEAKANNKNIAIFVTHATPPRPLFRRILRDTLDHCKACASQSNLIGFFNCPGEIAESEARTMLKEDSMLLQQITSMRAMSAGHPDSRDLQRARTFAKRTIKKIDDRA
jgi:flavodoxin